MPTHMVTTAATVRRQLRQVVDDARAHRHGNSVGLFQHVLQLLDIRPLRERIVVTVYVRFVLCDTGRVEIVLHGFAGQRIGDLVGHDNGRFPGNNSLNISAERGRASLPITSALVSVVRCKALSTLFISYDVLY